MKMTEEKIEEKIEILKELQMGYAHLLVLRGRLGIDYNALVNQLHWLKKTNMVSINPGYPPTWQITPEGIAAIKKWDKEGAQGELFEK